MPTLQCEIVTPVRELYSGQADFVVLPAAEGEMGVYAKHEPVVTTLNAGTVRVTEQGSKEPVRYIVDGGYAQVEAERVMILANRAMAVRESNPTQIRVEIDELKEQLADLADDDPNVAFINSEIAWKKTFLKHAEGLIVE